MAHRVQGGRRTPMTTGHHLVGISTLDAQTIPATGG
jgi:hypothetical protein